MMLNQQANPRSDMDDASDEKLEQVREILLGTHARDMAARLEELERRMHEMETRIGQRLDAMAARIEALSGEVDASHRSALDEIARGMQDLGDRVRQIRRG